MKKPALLLSIFLSGCAIQPVQLNVPELKSSDSVLLVDQRPSTEKENKIFSLSITSSAYGLYRKGDAVLNPPAIRLFQHRAFEKLAANHPNLSIKVHHFAVYLNAKSQLRRGVTGGVFGGIIGAAIATGTQHTKVNGYGKIIGNADFISSGDDEYKNALYTEAENPDKVSVIIVYIDAEVNGKRLFTRTMTALDQPDKQIPLTVAVEYGIDYFLSNI